MVAASDDIYNISGFQTVVWRPQGVLNVNILLVVKVLDKYILTEIY